VHQAVGLILGEQDGMDLDEKEEEKRLVQWFNDAIRRDAEEEIGKFTKAVKTAGERKKVANDLVVKSRNQMKTLTTKEALDKNKAVTRLLHQEHFKRCDEEQFAKENLKRVKNNEKPLTDEEWHQGAGERKEKRKAQAKPTDKPDVKKQKIDDRRRVRPAEDEESDNEEKKTPAAETAKQRRDAQLAESGDEDEEDGNNPTLAQSGNKDEANEAGKTKRPSAQSFVDKALKAYKRTKRPHSDEGLTKANKKKKEEEEDNLLRERADNYLDLYEYGPVEKETESAKELSWGKLKKQKTAWIEACEEKGPDSELKQRLEKEKYNRLHHDYYKICLPVWQSARDNMDAAKEQERVFKELVDIKKGQ